MRLSNAIATTRAAQRRRAVRRALAPAPIPTGELAFTFNATNPEVFRWASTTAATQITLVGAGTKRGVRHIVMRMFAEGMAPAVAAREIRDLVPLHKIQRDAVRRLERQLRDPKNFGKRITRFQPRPGVRDTPGFRVRIPPGGLSEAALARRLDQYRNMQLNWRSRNIARTESIRAANEGQREAWRQARDRGEIGANALREWSAAVGDNRTCVVCEELHGETATLDGDFPGGIDGPPAHSMCRCSTTLVTPAGTARTRALPRAAPGGTGGTMPTGVPLPPAGKFATPVPGSPRADQVFLHLQRIEAQSARATARVGARIEALKAETALIEKRMVQLQLRSQTGTAEYLKVKAEHDAIQRATWRQAARQRVVGERALKQQRRVLYRTSGEASESFIIVSPKFDPLRVGPIERGAEEFRRMVSKRWLTTSDITLRPVKKGRSFFHGTEVHLSPGSGSGTVIHELGHAIEEHDSLVQKAARKFWARRTAGESAVPLRSTGAKNASRYAADEMAKVDDFMHPYMGKIYPDNSEIISMGLEQMHKAPAAFYRSDPDHFDFIWHIMNGNIR